MNFSRVFALAGRLLLQIIRDRRAAILIIFVPILIMSLVTVLLRTSEKPIRVAVTASGTVDLFISDIESRLEKPVGGQDALTIVPLPDGTNPKDAVISGLVDAVLVFPRLFVEERATGLNSKLNLIIDGSDPTRSAEIFSALRKAVPNSLASLPVLLAEECDPHCADTIPKAPPDIEVNQIFGEHIHETMDYFTPVLPPFFVLFFVFLLSGLTFLRERVSGTAERILASPLRRTELVTGYVIGFLPAAFIQAALVILFAKYALGGPWGGLPVIAAILLLTLVAECLGVFISAYARTEFQMVQFIPIFILPQLLLSGLIWPIAGMPAWLKPLVYCLPLTYAVHAIREVSIKGYPFVHVWYDFAALTAFLVVTLALASRSIRRII
jgi:ABC-2 type transport system permease protein